MKNEILMAVMVLGLLSCKKKEEKPVEAPETPVVEDVCFQYNYNGTYTGSGVLTGSGAVNSYTPGYLTVTKTGCETADVGLSVPSKSYYFSEHISSLSSTPSGYTGKMPNGRTITLSLGSGKHIYVTADSAFTFNGIKP